MQMPVITVVMTVYNSSKTLERAYRSVIGQDYQNIELIIVDDASTDNSLKLAEKLIESGTNDKKVVLISNKKNYGTFVCRNYAITQATGEYFCFHDSDDTAEKNYISSLFTCLTSAAHRKIVVCKTNSRIPGRKNDVICAASSMFHSSLLDKIGFFDSVRFAADTEFRMRCQALLGQKSVFVLNKKLMRSYTSSTSLTGRRDIGIFSKPRKTYVSNFRKFHRTMSKKTKFEFPLSVRKFPVEKESLIGCDVDLSNFTVVKKTNISLSTKTKHLDPTSVEYSGGKVSVLMAAWKSKDYIEQAICSVLDQRLPKGMSLELIVGIDNCKETYDVVEKINDSRVGILFMNQNVGTYKTFNTMLQYASGDFIFRFDSDDVVGRDCLYHALSNLISNPRLTATQLLSVFMNEDMKKPFLPTWLKSPLTFKPAGQVLWRASDFKNKLGAYMPWTCAADREILSRAKFMRLQVAHTGLAYFCYRKHQNALTVKKDTSMRSQERRTNHSYIKSKEQSYMRGKSPEKEPANSFPHVKSGLLFSDDSSIIVHNFSFDIISEIHQIRVNSENFMKKEYK